MNTETSNLPYLVTRWLSEYAERQANETTINTQDVQDSIERIRQATRTLANEFSNIGAFGSTLSVSVCFCKCIPAFQYFSLTCRCLPHFFKSKEMTGNSMVESTNLMRNATYTDVSRKWQNVPNSHLESIVSSSAGATAAVWNAIRENTKHSSLMDAAHERDLQRKYGLMGDYTANQMNVNDGIVASTLQKPVLLTWDKESSSQSMPLETNRSDMSSVISTSNHANVRLSIGSDFNRMGQLYSQSFKRYLQIREKFDEEKRSLMQIKRSLAYQNRAKSDTTAEIESILKTTTSSASQNDSETETQRQKSDLLAQQMLEIDRVIAQLTRKLSELTQTHETESQQELNMSKSIANMLRIEWMSMKQTYVDPKKDSFVGFYDDWRLHISSGSKCVLNYVTSRSYGVNLRFGQTGPIRKRIGGNDTKRSLAQRCKRFFCHRISHVVTINAHLFYPVYCLRFDRTGRFFVTGSDDNVVKLFRLGTVGCEAKVRRGASSMQENISEQRGAVLICTLRGHASVITDIDVSSDNSLLATASEDGDVRIWGMTNGCPVAILRGHEGGANMVRLRFNNIFTKYMDVF
jgi:WD40 repeat protein